MRSPAAHPSVRSCNSSSDESATGTPPASNSARASSSEKRRSSARISVTSPSSRKRGRPSRRSRRVTSTNRSSAGERISRSLSWRNPSLERSSWRSSSTNHSGSSIAVRSASSRSTIASAFSSGFGVIASMTPDPALRAAQLAQYREPEALRVLLLALHRDPRGALALGPPRLSRSATAMSCRCQPGRDTTVTRCASPNRSNSSWRATTPGVR